jgi:sialic acid synthase SpsE
MPREWFKEMFSYARKKGLIVFSAVHWVPDIKFLLDLGSQVFKIASIDCNHLPLLKEVAKAGKPMIISTGMARLDEIDATVRFLRKAGNDKIALLHCVSCYPPKPGIVNLRNITLFKKRYPYPVGFSDHSVSNSMAVAAVALGATIIEKHLTLDRRTKGPDHPFALEPDDMIDLVRSVREVESALGSEKRILSKEELVSRKMIRRSLVARVHIAKGEIITEATVKYSRPSGGICPNDFEGRVKGRKAARDIPAETIITWGMVK